MGPDRVDVSRQCRWPRAGADDGADLCLDPAGAVRRRRADDRSVLRDRRLCDPERDVRHLADAGIWRGRFKKISIPLAPFTLALVLASRAEDAFRLSMNGSSVAWKRVWPDG